MSLLWVQAAVDPDHGFNSHLHDIREYGFDNVDTDAPNYYPHTTRSEDVVIHPDDWESWGLTATQRSIDSRHPAVQGYDPDKDTGRPVDLVAGEDGATYVNDGHHRLAGSVISGMPVRAKIHW